MKSVAFEVDIAPTKKGACSEILDGFLYLGSGANANDIKLLVRLGITHVVCMVSGWVPKVDFKEMSINFLHLPVFDSPSAQICDHFSRAVEFIDEAKSTNSKVLVHCAAGISRSATIVIAYLMNSHGMSLKAAYEHVYLRRKSIRPNTGFFAQLMELEQKLYNQTTMTNKDLANLVRLNNIARLANKPTTLSMSVQEGMAWAKTVVTEDILRRVFSEICDGVYIPEKTSDFLDKVMSEVKDLPAVQEKQENGYKWPRLSLNIMKTASIWYKAQNLDGVVA